MVGTGRAAELGVLFRKGDALQTLAGVTAIALDKTGTITKGHPELTDFLVAPGFNRAEVLALVAAVEARSEHPIAVAIVAAAEQAGVAANKQSNSPPSAGGRFPCVVWRRTASGWPNLPPSRGSASKPRSKGAMSQSVPIVLWRRAGRRRGFRRCGARFGEAAKSPIYAAVDGKLAGLIVVADPIAPRARQAVEALRGQELEILMVTGDNRRAAEAIARAVGIDNVIAEVLPEGKIEALDQLRARHQTIAFVGDGINDAPALAKADVGLAIGSGTDVAIEAADVVLMSGDLNGAATAVALSRVTMRNIRQNLFWAFAYNIILIPVAAGALYPAFGVLLSPMLAAGAMAFSSVFVVSNALRLRRFAPPVRRGASFTEKEKLRQAPAE